MKKQTPVIFAFAMTIFCAVSIAAQNSGEFWFAAKAAKGSEVSNLDLIKKIFPDAQVDANDPYAAQVAKAVPLRHLFGKDIPEISGYALTLDINQRLETVDGERGRILWLIIGGVRHNKENSSGSYYDWIKLLAAFRVSATAAELIDVAHIPAQNRTEFDEESPKLRIAPRRSAVVLSNVVNTTIGHSEVSIVGIGKNGFEILLNQFQMTTDYRCTDWFNETGTVRRLKNSVRGVSNLEIMVNVEGGPGEAEFARVKFRRRFRYVFAWNARLGKYVPIINPDRARRAFLKRVEPCRQLDLDDEN